MSCWLGSEMFMSVTYRNIVAVCSVITISCRIPHPSVNCIKTSSIMAWRSILEKLDLCAAALLCFK